MSKNWLPIHRFSNNATLQLSYFSYHSILLFIEKSEFGVSSIRVADEEQIIYVSSRQIYRILIIISLRPNTMDNLPNLLIS